MTAKDPGGRIEPYHNRTRAQWMIRTQADDCGTGCVSVI